MKKNKSQKPKLISLLETFDAESTKRFIQFIQSPYFNRRNDLVLLSEFLFSQMRKSTAIDQWLLVQSVYPDNHQSYEGKLHPSDSARIRNAMSKLMGLAEIFLVQEYREHNTAQNERDLIEALMQRKQYKHARFRLAAGLKKIKLLKSRNKRYYYDLFLLKEMEYKLNIIERNRSLAIDANSFIDAFELYFLSNIFLYYCASLNRANSINAEYRPSSLVQPISSYIEGNMDKMPALVRIYFLLFQLLGEKREVAFFDQIAATAYAHWEELTKLDIRQMFSLLLNVCNQEVRKGNLVYLGKKFMVYKNTVSTGIWSDFLYFSAHQFCQCIQNAIDNKELAFAKQFLQTHQDQLDPAYRSNVVNLSQAYIALAEKDYQKSHEHLANFSLKEDFYYKLTYKVTLIKLYYEQGEYEPLIDSLNALRVFLNPKRNNDWSADFAAACKAFHKMMTKLTKAKFGVKEKPRLNPMINDAPSLIERVWLLDMAKELTTKH